MDIRKYIKTKFINRAGLFELIQSSRMPKAQEFKNWVNSDLLPKLCDNGEYNMAKDAPVICTKVQFNNEEVETYTIDEDEKWMVANPFATVLKYNNSNKAIRSHVSEHNQRNYEDFKSAQIGLTGCVTSLPRNIQAKTKFINQAGLFELINASKMPAAKQFQAWNTGKLLPKLCQEGEYNMAKDAPVDVALGMNAVHAVTNNGREAPWLKDMECLKTAIVEKDRKIEDLTVALQESNQKLVITTEKLTDANETLTEAINWSLLPPL